MIIIFYYGFVKRFGLEDKLLILDELITWKQQHHIATTHPFVCQHTQHFPHNSSYLMVETMEEISWELRINNTKKTKTWKHHDQHNV